MIDIHSHILPGLDDGAKTMEESLAMVRQLHKAGFAKILATPHVLERRDFLYPEEILSVVEQVRERVAEAGIPVEILPGAENYIFPHMAKWAQARKLLTLGNTGKYLLVELPMLEIPHYTDQVFFELQVQDITPILAHPERNKGLINDPERLIDWANKGVLFQLNIRSLSGHYGPPARELAEIILSSDLFHFTGSDSHRLSRSELTYFEGFQRIKEIVGEERYQELTHLNPQRILDGKRLLRDKDYFLKEPVRDKRMSRFWSLFV